MERDQHSGAGQGADDRTRDLGNEAEPATPDQTPPPESEPGAQPDVIMSKLPRTRPQRATGRRQAPGASAGARTAAQRAKSEPAARKRTAGERAAAAKRATAVRSGGPAQRSAPERAKSRGATAPRAAKQRPVTRGSAAAAAAGPTPRRPATAAPTTRATPVPRPASSRAPGLPRLAMDGAVEAAKLPLKIGGRLTLRALDAVARGLRGS